MPPVMNAAWSTIHSFQPDLSNNFFYMTSSTEQYVLNKASIKAQ